MKKIIASLLLLTGFCAIAELPERAKNFVTKQRTEWFYNEMDRFDEEFPDAIADIEYSCAPDGDIFFGRRISGRLDFPPLYTEQQIRPALNRIETVTDSVYKIRKDDHVTYKATGSCSMIPEKKVVNHAAAYRFGPKVDEKIRDFEIVDAVTSFHNGDGYSESGGYIINDDGGAYCIMQEIFVPTGKKAKPADMSAIKAFYSHLSKPKNGRAEKKTKSSKDWHKIYDLFLDRLWTGEALTLKYSRALRTITITDMATHTDYIATYRNNILSLTITPSAR